MKNIKKILIVIFVIAVLVLGKIFFFSPDKPQAGGGGKSQGKQAVNVNAHVVKAQNMGNKIFVTGTVLSSEEADIVSEVSGKIVSLQLVEGASVAKGDLLVKINDAELQAQLKKLRSQENLAKENESRQKKLVDMNGISKAEYEAALNTLNSVQADIEFTQAQIAKTEIRAPFSGTVGLRSVSEGSFIGVGMKLASIQQLNPLKLDFFIPEKYALLVQKGSGVRFSVEGAEGTFEARVTALEPKIDIATRTVQVRAVCPNKQNKILPGAFAKIELTLKETENSLMIPTEALIPVLKGHKVFVSRNGMAEEVKVTAGLRTENTVQVVEGLSAGDTLITSGIMQLKKGAVVKIISVQ